MIRNWLKQYPFVSRGLLVTALSLVAISAVFFNLKGMEQARIQQYRNLAENLTEMAESYSREGRPTEFMDQMRMQINFSFVEFTGFYVDDEFIVRSGDPAAFGIPQDFLDSAEEDSLLTRRRGPRLFMAKKVKYAFGQTEKIGTMAMVFSMSEFHARQQNILWATLVIVALIAAVVGLFYLLDKSRLEIQEKNEDLQEARERLENEEQTRSDMTRAIAHDALHYVNVISLIIENQVAMRKKKQYLGNNGKYLQDIFESNDSLTQLLENLKYSEYLSQGQLINNPRKVIWVDFVSAVVVSIQELFKKKQISALFRHNHEPYKVAVDKELAKRVLLNLLHNAFKFTRPGSRIEIWLERHDRFIKTLVRDEGAGLQPKEWERIFQPSVRLDDSEFVRPEDMRGSGLGLSNARQFVLLYGGEMAVEDSRIGKGTTFYFTLPLAVETYGLEKEVSV